MTMMDDVYDSDDVCNASPRLQPTKIDYRPHVTPPPFLKEPDSPGKRSAGGRDPDPQLAHELGQKPLPTDSPRESSSPDNYRDVDEAGNAQDTSMSDVHTSCARQTAQHALNLILQDDDMQGEPQKLGAKVERSFGEELRAPSRPPYFLEPQASPQHLQSPMISSPIDKDIANWSRLKKLPISIPESQPRVRRIEWSSRSNKRGSASHANVHSQNRPFYCPVKGCPRGEGGKGFKRKNEMKRHGLVHDSPGYVCPFCPDQQHTYPRPDNLQRHVRVHHVDKDREDPELRRVLAQRPEGGMRGRRRRNGVQ
ncbi:C2H2 type zinc finger domain-containing protein [Blastomyces gilchristii SLH14081]|uniref:C2H2 type zinc finger domain-containing protein n=1 Tax=Blastomyces gilchristii (strain SLH14081) TaxID=559298 RepID=A0A179UP24_BLAGS|nr:C2H2 type zinc finger domain-containing protein [Blastomyces gilchristii SLH14081]OAT08857.1 C2H2 type zinc finger domain-containing protein [Blastomyces gilchristii SLH14081]